MIERVARAVNAVNAINKLDVFCSCYTVISATIVCLRSLGSGVGLNEAI